MHYYITNIEGTGGDREALIVHMPEDGTVHLANGTQTYESIEEIGPEHKGAPVKILMEETGEELTYDEWLLEQINQQAFKRLQALQQIKDLGYPSIEEAVAHLLTN